MQWELPYSSVRADRVWSLSGLPDFWQLAIPSLKCSTLSSAVSVGFALFCCPDCLFIHHHCNLPHSCPSLGVCLHYTLAPHLPFFFPPQYILRCREQLDPRFRMAAEVRCRSWFTGVQGQGWWAGEPASRQTAVRGRGVAWV